MLPIDIGMMCAFRKDFNKSDELVKRVSFFLFLCFDT